MLQAFSTHCPHPSPRLRSFAFGASLRQRSPNFRRREPSWKRLALPETIPEPGEGTGCSAGFRAHTFGICRKTQFQIRPIWYMAVPRLLSPRAAAVACCAQLFFLISQEAFLRCSPPRMRVFLCLISVVFSLHLNQFGRSSSSRPLCSVLHEYLPTPDFDLLIYLSFLRDSGS